MLLTPITTLPHLNGDIGKKHRINPLRPRRFPTFSHHPNDMTDSDNSDSDSSDDETRSTFSSDEGTPHTFYFSHLEALVSHDIGTTCTLSKLAEGGYHKVIFSSTRMRRC